MRTRNRVIAALASIAAVYGIAAAGAPRAFRTEGHRYHVGDAPSISCGSGATIAGTDEVGVVTFSGTTTSCTITFDETWSSSALNAVAKAGGGTFATQVPVCTANLSVQTVVGVSSVSHTAVTFAYAVQSEGSKLYFQCHGWMQ